MEEPKVLHLISLLSSVELEVPLDNCGGSREHNNSVNPFFAKLPWWYRAYGRWLNPTTRFFHSRPSMPYNGNSTIHIVMSPRHIYETHLGWILFRFKNWAPRTPEMYFAFLAWVTWIYQFCRHYTSSGSLLWSEWCSLLHGAHGWIPFLQIHGSTRCLSVISSYIKCIPLA